jgi:hypothetical protein
MALPPLEVHLTQTHPLATPVPQSCSKRSVLNRQTGVMERRNETALGLTKRIADTVQLHRTREPGRVLRKLLGKMDPDRLGEWLGRNTQARGLQGLPGLCRRLRSLSRLHVCTDRGRHQGRISFNPLAQPQSRAQPPHPPRCVRRWPRPA